METIDFWVDFDVGNSKKLQKLGLEGKINEAFNVFTRSNLGIFKLKMWKIKNVFTFGQIAQVQYISPTLF